MFQYIILCSADHDIILCSTNHGIILCSSDHDIILCSADHDIILYSADHGIILCSANHDIILCSADHGIILCPAHHGIILCSADHGIILSAVQQTMWKYFINTVRSSKMWSSQTLTDCWNASFLLPSRNEEVIQEETVSTCGKKEHIYKIVKKYLLNKIKSTITIWQSYKYNTTLYSIHYGESGPEWLTPKLKHVAQWWRYLY